MSKDWDFYFCRVDGELASIFVDLGIAASVPITALPHMAFIRLHMRQPRADGLSSQEEFATLSQIEDALEATLVVEGSSTYVGRNTTAGFRDFVFYLSDPSNWDARVKAALLPFGTYRCEVGSRPDPEWLAYRNFLHPSEENLERI